MKVEQARDQDHTRAMAPYDALILDASERQSLVAVRSLGSKGLRVAALDTSDNLLPAAFASRWCQHKTICHAHEGTDAYLSDLLRVLDETRARVLITSSDGTLALLRQHRELLERHAALALAKESALDIAVSKERTLEVARGLGLSIPRSVPVHNVSEVGVALREVGLPVVVKPVESWVDDGHSRKRLAAKLAVTPDEAQKAVEELTDTGSPVLFQQFLSGRRESIHLMYASGQIHARFAQWARRTLPPLGGLSVLRQSIPLPADIGEQSEGLIREIDLEGYSEVEFRRDAAGTPYLMEINPRLSASIELAVRSGVDFPYLMYQWATRQRIDTVRGYRVGQWMRYLWGDIYTTVETIREHGRPGVTPPAKALFEFCASFFVPMYYDTLDWQDPLPASMAFIDFMQRLPHSIKRKLHEARQKN